MSLYDCIHSKESFWGQLSNNSGSCILILVFAVTLYPGILVARRYMRAISVVMQLFLVSDKSKTDTFTTRLN